MMNYWDPYGNIKEKRVEGGWDWDVVDNIDETRFQINILHGWDYINMKTKICNILNCFTITHELISM